MRRLWRLADERGFDWFSVSDHFQETPPQGGDGDCFEAVSSPAFETGTDYRPIRFVDAQIPPGPGALGHVSDISVLLAASGKRSLSVRP